MQIAVNDDPADTGEDDCETVYFACHNANFNVLGIVDDAGELVERYEYTPYGQRMVFVNSGSNDTDTSAPVLESTRVTTTGSVTQPYGLNEVGHQGLLHNKETTLIYNRARMHHPRLGRFMQRDPLGYVDGMGLHQYVGSNAVNGKDPLGKVQEFWPNYAQGRQLSVKKGAFTLQDVWSVLAKLADPPLVVDKKAAEDRDVANPAAALTAEQLARTKRRIVMYADTVEVDPVLDGNKQVKKWLCPCGKGKKLAFSKKAAVLRQYHNDKNINLGVQGAVDSLMDIIDAAAHKIADPAQKVIGPGFGSIVPQMDTGAEAAVQAINASEDPFHDMHIRSRNVHKLVNDLDRTLKFMHKSSKKDLVSLAYTMKCVDEDARGKYIHGRARKLYRSHSGEKMQYVRFAQQVTSGGKVVPLRVTEEHIIQYFEWE